MFKRFGLRWWKAATSFALLLILFSLCTSNMVSAINNSSESNELIQQTEDSIQQAFEIVSEAERIGANVSLLIAKLNEAENLLTEAEKVLSNGDYADAVELANNSIQTAAAVNNEASNQLTLVKSHNEFVFQLYTIGSVVGVAAFLLFMLLLWRKVIADYARKVLEMKVEAV